MHSAPLNKVEATDTNRKLREGVAIPAHPLALDAQRRLHETRQRALSRYYLDAGAGGLAVGVHTTQFEIHGHGGMLRDVLSLAREEVDRFVRSGGDPVAMIAGICGDTRQAVREAGSARDLGYEYGLVSMNKVGARSDKELIRHCRAIGESIKLFGFYLQQAVGGIRLSHAFWRSFCELDQVVAIKVAPFNRYATLEVVRAVAESGRNDIALYTGNDDNIISDLITPYEVRVGSKVVKKHFVGGLLGQWAVDTRRSVEILNQCRRAREDPAVLRDLLRLAAQLTDMNFAIFDAANGFRGCIPGIHEVLRRQGLLEVNVCLDERQALSHSQADEISRVRQSYPYLTDDQFIAENLHKWLS